MDSIRNERDANGGEPQYIPPMAFIIKKIGGEIGLSPNHMFQIPYQLVEYLITGWVYRARFDENYYLSRYPDVMDALEKRTIMSAEEHYRTRGYFEGRVGAPTMVDRDFYLSSYPDVARAYARGLVKDLQTHYDETGQYEGRYANLQQKIQLETWAEKLSFLQEA